MMDVDVSNARDSNTLVNVQNEYKEQIEKTLLEAIANTSDMPETLYEAMQYSLMAGGKRMRPSLVLAVADCLEEQASQREDVRMYAAALEMIHTYSLIHDDLPAMDNDDLRRGKPTSHIKFGEAMAILAGDGLLTRAFSLMQIALSAKGDTHALPIVHAWNCLADSAGPEGMIAGQVIDIESEGQAIDLENLRLLQSLKTGKLLQAAVLGACKLMAVDQAIEETFSRFALHMGIAFQIQDDILDVEASAEDLGKTPGKDAANDKATFVTHLGLEGAKQELQRETFLAKQELSMIQEAGYATKFLEFYLESMSVRTH